MLLLVAAAAAFVAPIAPAQGRLRHAEIRATATGTYHRAKDILSTDASVTEKDVVNVLGRWETYQQWEKVGKLAEMDKLMTAEGQMKVKLPAQQSSGLLAKKKGNGDCAWTAFCTHPAARPSAFGQCGFGAPLISGRRGLKHALVCGRGQEDTATARLLRPQQAGAALLARRERRVALVQVEGTRGLCRCLCAGAEQSADQPGRGRRGL